MYVLLKTFILVEKHRSMPRLKSLLPRQDSNSPPSIPINEYVLLLNNYPYKNKTKLITTIATEKGIKKNKKTIKTFHQDTPGLAFSIPVRIRALYPRQDSNSPPTSEFKLSSLVYTCIS